MRRNINFANVNKNILRRKGEYLLSLVEWIDENGYTKIGYYMQEAFLYLFSVVTEILPTYVRWDSSIGKMERLMRE